MLNQAWDWEDGDGGYLAPELLLDHPPSPASDMFSFGAMLFEWVYAHKLPRSSTPHAFTHPLPHSHGQPEQQPHGVCCGRPLLCPPAPLASVPRSTHC